MGQQNNVNSIKIKKVITSRDNRQSNTAFFFHDKCMQAKMRPSIPCKKDNTAVYLCVCVFCFFCFFFLFFVFVFSLAHKKVSVITNSRVTCSQLQNLHYKAIRTSHGSNGRERYLFGHNFLDLIRLLFLILSV